MSDRCGARFGSPQLHWKRCRVHRVAISFSNTILVCVLFAPPSLPPSFLWNDFIFVHVYQGFISGDPTGTCSHNSIPYFWILPALELFPLWLSGSKLTPPLNNSHTACVHNYFGGMAQHSTTWVLPQCAAIFVWSLDCTIKLVRVN